MSPQDSTNDAINAGTTITLPKPSDGVSVHVVQTTYGNDIIIGEHRPWASFSPLIAMYIYRISNIFKMRTPLKIFCAWIEWILIEMINKCLRSWVAVVNKCGCHEAVYEKVLGRPINGENNRWISSSINEGFPGAPSISHPPATIGPTFYESGLIDPVLPSEPLNKLWFHAVILFSKLTKTRLIS